MADLLVTLGICPLTDAEISKALVPAMHYIRRGIDRHDLTTRALLDLQAKNAKIDELEERVVHERMAGYQSGVEHCQQRFAALEANNAKLKGILARHVLFADCPLVADELKENA